MANIDFVRGDTDKINETPITDGQLLFDTTNDTIFMDNGTERKNFGIGNAKNVNYDNSSSSLQGTNIQDATDEISDKLDTMTDNTNKRIDAIETKIITNLLNPTLQTQKKNGVTCTNNGDGTYTLNGTAESGTSFTLASMEDGKINIPFGLYEIVGGTELAYIQVFCDGEEVAIDTGNGSEFSILPYNTSLAIRVFCLIGIHLDNVVIKPMITSDLTASYNDFVPYTGTTGKINSDVAQLNSNLSEISNEVETKQDQLTFDTTPTANSTNPVTSGGVLSALNGKVATNRIVKVNIGTLSSTDVVQSFNKGTYTTANGYILLWVGIVGGVTFYPNEHYGPLGWNDYGYGTTTDIDPNNLNKIVVWRKASSHWAGATVSAVYLKAW